MLFNWFSFDFLSNCGFVLGDGEAESRRGRRGSEVIPRFTFKERKYAFLEMQITSTLVKSCSEG